MGREGHLAEAALAEGFGAQEEPVQEGRAVKQDPLVVQADQEEEELAVVSSLPRLLLETRWATWHKHLDGWPCSRQQPVK